MARPTHVYTIEYVATLISENLELIEEVARNSDNIDYGEMIHAYDGTEEGVTTFTERGVESLKEFLADVRTWECGVRQFLVDEQCDPEVIKPSWQTSRNHKPRGLRRMDTRWMTSAL
ncbi:hypothetical protein GCM10023069_01260 [Shinella granuli]